MPILLRVKIPNQKHLESCATNARKGMRTSVQSSRCKSPAMQESCDADVAKFGLDWAAGAIASHAESVGSTSNGAHNVYLDSGGWCEIPFVTDDE